MADGSFPGLVSRNRDVNADDNVIFTGITDDAGNLVSVTGNALDVNATVTLETAYADNSTEFTVDTSDVNAQGFLVDEVTPTTVTEGRIGLARMTADRKMIVELADATTDANRLEINANGAATTGTEHVNAATFGVLSSDVWPAAYIIDETTPSSKPEGAIAIPRITPEGITLTILTDDVDNDRRLTINSDGSINVNFTEAVVSGEIHDYDTASAIASDATDNHDYTVANATFLLKSVIVSGSGNIKFEIQTGPIASLATVAVGFLTGRQGDTKQVFFDPAVEVPVASTGTVRVIRTNRQGASTDLYSTIVGLDI